MKLLVLAQKPPPLHGQSLMVRMLVEGLPHHGIAVHHVNLGLSRNSEDIGTWRPGKVAQAVWCACRAVILRLRLGCDMLYYVPAPPAKRGALYRDWMVMLICRPFFRQIVFHWHAAGLGDWLESRATPLERRVTAALLGRVDLAIVLANSLRSDAEVLRARRTAVVPNGIADPAPPARAAPPRRPFQVLFLGLCSESKGVFAAAEAIAEANRRENAPDDDPSFALTAAGPFPDRETADRFRRLTQIHPMAVRYLGVVHGDEKERLIAESHCLCLPTEYPAEAMPLVAIEALAHDRPVVATRWRGLPELVSRETGSIVESRNCIELADALVRIRDQPPPAGACRARYLALFTGERHLKALAAALRSLA